ncbi:MAG TPA: class I SAM-dependent methyltransferase [Mobilitalea sp.]|nr:class I SAM-dependent methyltransferase [Mobilitalea sp.]
MDSIANYYNTYDEDGRLFRDNCHRMEYITTMHYFEKYFSKGDKILDACAGTGNYSFKLAELGYQVTAGDLVLHNVDFIRMKNNLNPILDDIYQGSVTDLSRFDNESFDVVLCMGAFYHMKNEERLAAVKECLRDLKSNGYLVISYINSVATTLASLSDRLENMEEMLHWYRDNDDSVFLHMSPEEIEQIAKKYNTEIIVHIATDGMAFLLRDKVNNASPENFDKWVQFHLDTCEDKSILGSSLHGLIILKKS